MKQECSSIFFDELFLGIFIENTGEKWVLKSGARPNGDASAINLYSSNFFGKLVNTLGS